jgi:hypothetical protein
MGCQGQNIYQNPYNGNPGHYPNRSPFHSHALFGPTTFNDGHIHHYGAVTQPGPTGVPHTHQVYSITTLNDGHVHRYMTTTSVSIPAEQGHYHEYYAVTEFADGHTHRLQGYTSID